MNEPIVIAGIIAFSGTIISVVVSVIIAVIGVRNVQIGASDEISAAAVALVEPLKKALTEASAKIEKQAAEITNLTNRLAVIEGEHAREIKRHTDQIVNLRNDYKVLQDKHNHVVVELAKVRNEYTELSEKYTELYNDYERERCARLEEERTNHKLSARVEALEKGDTGPLKEKK